MADAIAASVIATPTRQGPALSATSDAPDTQEAPAIAVEVTGGIRTEKQLTLDISKTEEASEGTETHPDSVAKPAEDTQEKTDETPAWMKREITKARNKARQAEQRAADLEAKANENEARLTTALKALESATARKEAEEKADPRPQRSDFQDPNQYEDALINWSSRTAAEAARREAEREANEKQTKAQKEEADRKAADELRALQTAWQTKREKAIEENPDWEEVAERDDVTVTVAMSRSILEEENGTDILYYLGKNPKEAERIGAMPVPRQIAEIGRLSAKLAAPAPAVSRAPKPITKIGSRAVATETPLAEKSMEEYAAARQAQIRREWQERHGVPKVN